MGHIFRPSRTYYSTPNQKISDTNMIRPKNTSDNEPYTIEIIPKGLLAFFTIKRRPQIIATMLNSGNRNTVIMANSDGKEYKTEYLS